MSHSDRSHFIKNLVSQYGLVVITTVLGLISAPISLSYWKAEQYGLWSVMTSLVIYLSVSGLGIDSAAGILMTKTFGRAKKLSILFRALTIVVIVSIVLLGIVLLLELLRVDWTSFVGKVSPDLKATVSASVLVFVVGSLINLPFGVIANSLAAWRKAFWNNALNGLQSLLTFLSLLACVWLELDMVEYALAFVGATLLCNLGKVVVYVFVVRTYESSEAGPAESAEDTSNRSIIATGLRLSSYGIAVIIGSNSSSLMISNLVALSSVVSFSLAMRLFSIAFTFIGGIALAMAPVIGERYSHRDWDWLSQQYTRLHALVLGVSSLAAIAGMFFMKDVILLWVGIEGVPDHLTVVGLSLWLILYSMTSLNLVFANSLNWVKRLAWVSWGDVVVYLVLSLMLVPVLGVAGVGVAMVLGNILVSQWAIPLHLAAKSEGRLSIPMKFYLLPMGILLLALCVSTITSVLGASLPVRLAVGLVCTGGSVWFLRRSMPLDLIFRRS